MIVMILFFNKDTIFKKEVFAMKASIVISIILSGIILISGFALGQVVSNGDLYSFWRIMAASIAWGLVITPGR